MIPPIEQVVKIDERVLTAEEFEEVLRVFYITGYQRATVNGLLSLQGIEKSFQNTLHAFGLKTK